MDVKDKQREGDRGRKGGQRKRKDQENGVSEEKKRKKIGIKLIWEWGVEIREK